jgi:hypothetical protein
VHSSTRWTHAALFHVATDKAVKDVGIAVAEAGEEGVLLEGRRDRAEAGERAFDQELLGADKGGFGTAGEGLSRGKVLGHPAWSGRGKGASAEGERRGASRGGKKRDRNAASLLLQSDGEPGGERRGRGSANGGQAETLLETERHREAGSIRVTFGEAAATTTTSARERRCAMQCPALSSGQSRSGRGGVKRPRSKEYVGISGGSSVWRGGSVRVKSVKKSQSRGGPAFTCSRCLRLPGRDKEKTFC